MLLTLTLARHFTVSPTVLVHPSQGITIWEHGSPGGYNAGWMELRGQQLMGCTMPEHLQQQTISRIFPMIHPTEHLYQ